MNWKDLLIHRSFAESNLMALKLVHEDFDVHMFSAITQDEIEEVDENEEKDAGRWQDEEVRNAQKKNSTIREIQKLDTRN